MESICCVYCIENLVNHKKYIGQTCDYAGRKRHHLCMLRGGTHNNSALQADFDTFGEENFEFRILEHCSECVLDLTERYYIRFYETMDSQKGYNRESGGNAKKYVSEETKRLISFHHADVSGENNPMYGIKHTEEAIQKYLTNPNYISRKHKGEDSHLCTITEDTARAIKKHFADNHPIYRGELVEIAKKYNTSRTIVSHIKNGYTWNWLTV